jgi:hypothetical protein
MKIGVCGFYRFSTPIAKIARYNRTKKRDKHRCGMMRSEEK